MTDQPEFDDLTFWQEPDFLLNDLVSMFANLLDAEIGITLMVGGSILSGMLVGEQAYLKAVNSLVKRLARELDEEPVPEIVEELVNVFSPGRLTEDRVAEMMNSDEPESAITRKMEDDLVERQMPLRYLHLRDPILIQPGTMLHFSDSDLPIMRLRLSQIDGWIIGRANVLSSDAFGDTFPPGGIVH